MLTWDISERRLHILALIVSVSFSLAGLGCGESTSAVGADNRSAPDGAIPEPDAPNTGSGGKADRPGLGFVDMGFLGFGQNTSETLKERDFMHVHKFSAKPDSPISIRAQVSDSGNGTPLIYIYKGDSIVAKDSGRLQTRLERGGEYELVVSDFFRLSSINNEAPPSFKYSLTLECRGSPVGRCASGSIRIGSWNIANFGVSKVGSPQIMSTIIDTLTRYDVVAIQEIQNIREKDDPNCPRNAECPDHERCGMVEQAFKERLNEPRGNHYKLAISNQVRHERYLFIYNADRVDLVGDRLVEDPEESKPTCAYRPDDTGAMVRQPHLGIFRAGGFSFGLLNTHIVPEEAASEIKELVQYQKEYAERGVSDLIMLGDLNADCSYLNEGQIGSIFSDYTQLVKGVDTTVATGSNCTYDRIVVSPNTKEDAVRNGRVYSHEQITEDVSDHYPISARFALGKDTDQHHPEVSSISSGEN